MSTGATDGLYFRQAGEQNKYDLSLST